MNEPQPLGPGHKPTVGELIAAAGGVYAPPSPPREPPDLVRRWGSWRTLFSAGLTLLVTVLALLAMVPLFSVLYMLVVKGGQRVDWALFTEVPPAALMAGGGIANALQGTLLMVGIAAAISVPVGILAAVFLGELAPDSKTAEAVRFAAKVMTGLPSVLAGLFAYASVVLLLGGYSALAGGIALSLLMIPTVLLTAEQAIKMVPVKMREAAFGMGATRSQVAWHITLPTAMPGILTGVMLAVARAAGETAPLLFTAMSSDYWLTTQAVAEPTPSLAVLIYDFSSSPFSNQKQVAWAASLVLVFLVLLANIAAQLWSGKAEQR